MRRVFLACAIAVGIALVLSSSAFAQSVTRVSSGDPDASCTLGAAPGSVANPGTEVEPYLVDNPSRPANLLGAWQQDRWSDGGGKNLVAGWSFNGGTSWGETQLPFSECDGAAGVPYQRASDPGVAFGPDGRAYAIAIVFDGTTTRNGVAAATSTDGGKTWSAPKLLIRDVGSPTTGDPFNDKELIFADPVHAGVAYAVWDRLLDVAGQTATRAPLILAKRGAARRTGFGPQQQQPAFTGPAYFSETTNGGATWQAPRPIVQTGVNEQTIGNYLVTDPRTDTLYDFFTYITADGVSHAAFVSSSNRGATWSSMHVFADQQTVGVKGYRTGSGLLSPAIDPRTGALYVTWEDARFNGGQYDEVALTSSRDGGRTWSAVARVNPASASGQPAYTPTVAVNASGAVAVTYYQSADFQANDETNYDVTLSRNGGRTFSRPSLLAGPFDMSTAPSAGGYFVGDYEAIATAGDTFYPFFVTTTGLAGDPTDVYTTAVSSP